MAKANIKKTKPIQNEAMSTRVLKVILYIVLGTIWLKFRPAINGMIDLPLGLALGAIFASQDHFAIDRRIEYGVLIVATIVSYWLPVGIVV